MLTKQKVKTPRRTQKPFSAEMAEKIAAVLGYKEVEVARKSQVEAASLATVLANLNISVLNPRSVDAYKKRRVEEEKKKSKKSRYYYTTFSWKSVPLEKYRKPIPLGALKTAVTIKEAMPEAKFVVEELLKNRRPIPDPFLVVKAGSAKYYIEQWDEPSFEDEQQ